MKPEKIRDHYSLKIIDKLLDPNDKVFIVFSDWHLLTCEPGLSEILFKKRD